MASVSAATSLSAVSAVGAGTVLDASRAVRTVTMVVIPTGIVTGGQVELEGSQDNLNWVSMNIVTPAGRGPVAVTTQLCAFRYWRARVTMAVTGGGTIKATLMEGEYNGGLL